MSGLHHKGLKNKGFSSFHLPKAWYLGTPKQIIKWFSAGAKGGSQFWASFRSPTPGTCGANRLKPQCSRGSVRPRRPGPSYSSVLSEPSGKQPPTSTTAGTFSIFAFAQAKTPAFFRKMLPQSLTDSIHNNLKMKVDSTGTLQRIVIYCTTNNAQNPHQTIVNKKNQSTTPNPKTAANPKRLGLAKET